ncbi:hypothetical protein F5B19DRAFT_496562 [Rostrohypoxylon terebratum]|nr:hypothetical protein F5B19DRAFT_496562 [Rostrohypoxylon terebratum]
MLPVVEPKPSTSGFLVWLQIGTALVGPGIVDQSDWSVRRDPESARSVVLSSMPRKAYCRVVHLSARCEEKHIVWLHAYNRDLAHLNMDMNGLYDPRYINAQS